jgi:hypothetical protein
MATLNGKFTYLEQETSQHPLHIHSNRNSKRAFGLLNIFQEHWSVTNREYPERRNSSSMKSRNLTNKSHKINKGVQNLAIVGQHENRIEL